MAEKALTAILSAQQTIAAELEEVANALEDVAEDAGITGETMQRVEDATDGARNAMGQQAATLQAVEEKFEGASVEAKQLAMTEDQVAEAAERVRNSQSEMAAVTDAAETQLAEESQTFREAVIGANSLEEAKQAASKANQVLSTTAQKTQKALDEEISEMYQMATAADSTDTFIDRLKNSQLALSAAVEEAEEDLRGMSIAMAANQVAAMADAETLDHLEEKIEEVGDEATETALSMAGLSSAFAATSLNIGPFNFALENAATKIPQLVAVSGSLATALGGVATAATTAGGALMGIFGGGVLAMAEQMAATSSKFKNRWEAIQGVFKQVRSTLVRALEPLMNQQSIEMFQSFITGLASALNMAAQMAVSLQEELQAFGNEISAAFFSNANEILTELENTVEAFLPILADFAQWFFEKLPAALRFFQDEGVRFTKALARFGQRVINFFRAFSEFGISAMEGILPAIGAVIEALSMVVDILNMLPDEVIALAAGFLLLSRAMEGVVGIGLRLGQFFTGIIASVGAATGALGKFGAVLAGLHFDNILEATALLTDRLGMMEMMFNNTSDTARDAMRDINSIETPEDGLFPDEAVSEGNLKESFDSAIQKVRTKMDEMKNVMVSTLDDIAVATRGKMDDIAGAIIGGASAVRESMGEVAGTAIAGFQSRIRAFNVDDSFRQNLATDVALGGPRITRDVPETEVHTKTGRARQNLARFRDAIVRTGGRVRTFASDALGRLRSALASLPARGIGVISVMTGIGEAAISAVPGLGNFERAVNNIRTGLETISPTMGSFINRQLSRIPTSMAEANTAALRFADGLNTRLTPYLDSLNDRLLRFADGLNARLLPVVDSANDRMLNFADALDPNKDLTFYDIAADKINTLRRSARSAGETIASSLLGIDFTDSGIRNLRTGQFTTFGKAVKDRALAPVRLFSEGLSTATTRLGEYKQTLVGVIPTMTQMNNSALGAADAVDEAVSPALDTANDRANSFADRLNARLLPVIDSANDRMLKFADALDPQKDLSFYDIFAEKLGRVRSRARAAGEALAGSLLGVDFTDSGIRDLQTGQFTSLSKVIRDRLSSAAATAIGPFRRMGSAVMDAGAAVRSSADDFAAAIANIESYDDAVALASSKIDDFVSRVGQMATAVGSRAVGAVRDAVFALYEYVGAAFAATFSTESFNFSLSTLSKMPRKAAVAIYEAVSAVYSYISGISIASITSFSFIGALTTIAGMSIPVISSLAALAVAFYNVAAAEGVATAAAGMLSLALDALGIGLIIKAIAALVAISTVMVAVLGTMGKEGNALAGVFNTIKSMLEGVFNYLMSVGIPVFNMLIDAFEFLYAVGSAANQILTAFFQALGLVGSNSSFVSTIISVLVDTMKFLADAIGWLARKLGDLFDWLTQQIKKIPGVSVDSKKFEGMKVSQQDVRAGAKKAGKAASGLTPGGKAKKAQPAMASGGKTVKNTYKKNEYNFGDFNMKPEEKARVKGLVQKAMEEANRTKRIRDGGV